MVLSDSILSRMETYHKEYLKDALGVNQLATYAFPGKTAIYILDPGSWIYNDLMNNQYRCVLISAGQNDISKTIGFGTVEEVSSIVYTNVSEYIKTFARDFPDTYFILLPLTLRAVCSKEFTRFPQSKKIKYIIKVNQVIKHLSKLFKNLANELENFFSVDGDFLWKHSDSLLLDDGIHLSSSGLDRYLTESLSVVRPRIRKR